MTTSVCLPLVLACTVSAYTILGVFSYHAIKPTKFMQLHHMQQQVLLMPFHLLMPRCIAPYIASYACTCNQQQYQCTFPSPTIPEGQNPALLSLLYHEQQN